MRGVRGKFLFAFLFACAVLRAEPSSRVKEFTDFLDSVFFGNGRLARGADSNPLNWFDTLINDEPALGEALAELEKRRGPAFANRVRVGIDAFTRRSEEARKLAKKNLRDEGFLHINPSNEIRVSLQGLLGYRGQDPSGGKKPWARMNDIATAQARAKVPGAFTGSNPAGLNDPAARDAYDRSMLYQEVFEETPQRKKALTKEELTAWAIKEEKRARAEAVRAGQAAWFKLAKAGLVIISLDRPTNDPAIFGSQILTPEEFASLNLVAKDHGLVPSAENLGTLHFQIWGVEHAKPLTPLPQPYLFNLMKPGAVGSPAEVAIREAHFLSTVAAEWESALAETLRQVGTADPRAVPALLDELHSGARQFLSRSETALSRAYGRRIQSGALEGLIYAPLEADAQHWEKRQAASWNNRNTTSLQVLTGAVSPPLRPKNWVKKIVSGAAILGTAAWLAAHPVLPPSYRIPLVLPEVFSQGELHETSYEAFNKDRSGSYRKVPILKITPLDGKPLEALPNKYVSASPAALQWKTNLPVESRGAILKLEGLSRGETAWREHPVSLPTPIGTYLAALELTDRAGRRLVPNVDFIVKEAVSGGYLIYPGPGKESVTFKFGASFAPSSTAHTTTHESALEQVVPAEGVERAAALLESGGYRILPQVLRETLRTAQEKNLPVRLSHVRQILAEKSFYSDVPERAQLPFIRRSPIERLARFLNDEGTHCSQCDGFQELSKVVLDTMMEGVSGFHAEPRSLFVVSPGSDVIRRGDAHADVLFRADGILGEFDATSPIMDPRNPTEKKSGGPPGDPLFPVVAGLIERWSSALNERRLVTRIPTSPTSGDGGEPGRGGEERKETETAPPEREPLTSAMLAHLSELDRRMQAVKDWTTKLQMRAKPTDGLPFQRLYRLGDLLKSFQHGALTEAEVIEGMRGFLPEDYVWPSGPFSETLREALSTAADRIDKQLQDHAEKLARGKTKKFPELAHPDFMQATRDGFRWLATVSWEPPPVKIVPFSCETVHQRAAPEKNLAKY